jgi:hypothetical protein
MKKKVLLLLLMEPNTLIKILKLLLFNRLTEWKLFKMKTSKLVWRNSLLIIKFSRFKLLILAHLKLETPLNIKNIKETE